MNEWKRFLMEISDYDDGLGTYDEMDWDEVRCTEADYAYEDNLLAWGERS